LWLSFVTATSLLLLLLLLLLLSLRILLLPDGQFLLKHLLLKKLLVKSLLLSLLLNLLFKLILISVPYLSRDDLPLLLHSSSTGVGSLAIRIGTGLLAGLVWLPHDGMVLFLSIFVLLLLILFILLVTDIRLPMGILLEIGCLTFILGRLRVASSLDVRALDAQLTRVTNGHGVSGRTLPYLSLLVVAGSWLGLGLDLKFGFLRTLRSTLVMWLFLEGFAICSILLGDIGTSIRLKGEAGVVLIVAHCV
jgi:hypothetical protein